MDANLIYTTPHVVSWDWRVAADLFFGGIGVGAFLLAVINNACYRGRHNEITKLAAAAAPLFLIIGLLFLMSELGHPDRFWRAIIGFNPTSPISWGAAFQVLMVIVGVLYWRSFIHPQRTPTPRRIYGAIGVPLALIVGAYHGFLLTVVRARPLWNAGPSTVSAIVAFVITGMALVALLLCFHPRRSQLLESIKVMRLVLGVALVTQVFTHFIWWISLNWGTEGAREALATANATVGPLFWYGAIGMGLILPLLIGGVTTYLERRRHSPVNTRIVALTSTLILVGGFIFRYAILMGGQSS